MKTPNPEKYAQPFDPEIAADTHPNKKEGYDTNAPQNNDAKLEVHGKNPPKDRNLPNLKK